MNHRTEWVDYAKAIGIILVVYGHVARGVFNAGINFPEPIFQLVDSVIYSFHMPLFFFLSGLFFYSSFAKRGAMKFVSSKVDTIFYPYVVWSILQGGIEIFLSSYTNGNVLFEDVISFLWAPRAQFWFLYTLFFVCVFSSFVYLFSPKRLTLVFLAFSVFIYIFPTVVPDFRLLHLVANNLVFFALGIVFTLYIKVEYFSRIPVFFGILCSFVFSQWFFHCHYDLLYTDRNVWLLLLSFISILFLVSVSTLLAKNNFKVLVIVGQSSMAIYLMHIIAGSGARIFLSKFLGVDNVLAHLIFGCFVAILAPLVGLLLINKIKVPFLFSAPISSLLFSVCKKYKGAAG